MCRMLYGHNVNPRSYSILSNITLEIGSKYSAKERRGLTRHSTGARQARFTSWFGCSTRARSVLSLIAVQEKRGELSPHEAAPASTWIISISGQIEWKARARRRPAATVRLL